jgi:hypothetical protein
MTQVVTSELRRELDAVKARIEELEKRMPDYWPNDPEGELSKKTKRQLARSRATPLSDYVSHDELGRRLGIKSSKVR